MYAAFPKPCPTPSSTLVCTDMRIHGASTVDIVDINSVVLEAAQQHFGLNNVEALQQAAKAKRLQRRRRKRRMTLSKGRGGATLVADAVALLRSRGNPSGDDKVEVAAVDGTGSSEVARVTRGRTLYDMVFYDLFTGNMEDATRPLNRGIACRHIHAVPFDLLTSLLNRAAATNTAQVAVQARRADCKPCWLHTRPCSLVHSVCDCHAAVSVSQRALLSRCATGSKPRVSNQHCTVVLSLLPSPALRSHCFVSLRSVVVPQVCFASRQPIQFRLPVASSPDEFTAATAVADFQSWEVTSAYLLAQGVQEAAVVSVSVLTAPAHTGSRM